MKAVAVRPGNPNSVHMVDAPMPKVTDIPDGRGVLVKVLKVGVDATDKEINEAKYGNAPEGCNYLIIGHEVFGVVQEVGPSVKHVKPGDYVTLTVRRPGNSIYDLIGTNDMTSESTYYERGINLRHGFMTEYVVDDAEFVVPMPKGLKHMHILAEPMSCAAKAIHQAYEAQRRLKVWRPKVAYVLGVGQIGLLATLILRLRGIEVYSCARSAKGTINSKIVEGLGAHYISTRETPLAELAKKVGKADLIIECTGSSASAFGAMEVLGLNGAMVWTSVTGGHAKTEVPFGQDQSRLGARQQAASGQRKRQPRTLRDGHPLSIARGLDVPRRDAANPHDPGTRARQLPRDDASLGGREEPEGVPGSRRRIGRFCRERPPRRSAFRRMTNEPSTKFQANTKDRMTQ
jgi:threonine dehydrogenase-like Zn-dependent dehydrogenase